MTLKLRRRSSHHDDGAALASGDARELERIAGDPTWMYEFDLGAGLRTTTIGQAGGARSPTQNGRTPRTTRRRSSPACTASRRSSAPAVIDMVEDTCVDVEALFVDTAPMNMNGARRCTGTARPFRLERSIHDIDLDRQFRLPREHYGLIFFLRILHYLQNPFYVLREPASCADRVRLSTKVACFAATNRTPISDLPVPYLVAPLETNNDPTNCWVPSPVGLERLVDRVGWDVLDKRNVGNTSASDPATLEGDEREFMLLRSRLARG